MRRVLLMQMERMLALASRFIFEGQQHIDRRLTPSVLEFLASNEFA